MKQVREREVEAFYSTIFLGVMALFGLLVAALIFVSQTVQDRYSARLAQRLLKGHLSLSFWFIGLFTVLSSSIALFDIAFPIAANFPGLPSALVNLPKGFAFGVVTLSGVFLTLVLFLVTLRSFSKLVSPLGVLRELARDLTPRAIRDIALLRLYEDKSAPQIEFSALAEFLSETEEGKSLVSQMSPSAADVPANSRWQKVRKRVSGFLSARRRNKPSEIAKLKRKLSAAEKKGKLEDPLSDLFEYALLAIKENNAYALREVLARIVSVFRSAIQEGLLSQDSQVPFLADKLLLEGLNRFVNEVEITRRFSFVLQLTDSMKELCSELTTAGLWSRVHGFFDFFQDTGSAAILRKDQPAFERATKALVEIGITSLQNENQSEVFDDACRKVGWLGEKLILRGIEDAPIMASWNEAGELSDVREAIYRLTDAVCRARVEKYPIILKDAIEVVCDQILKKNEPRKFRDTIVNLLIHHGDLAENLISRRSKSAEIYLWVTLNYLKDLLEEYDLKDYGELKGDIFKFVADLGREAIQNNQVLHETGGDCVPGPRDLLGMIIHFMTEMGEPGDWDGEMSEVLHKSVQHHDEAWDFIKRAGIALHSNFGLMFDEETGEDYATDDPRRHFRL